MGTARGSVVNHPTSNGVPGVLHIRRVDGVGMWTRPLCFMVHSGLVGEAPPPAVPMYLLRFRNLM